MMVLPDRAGLRTGEVAEQAGVNIQTLRYYERRGLLTAPHRTNGGHRLYPADTVALLNVIKAAQRLGFTPRRGRTCADCPIPFRTIGTAEHPDGATA